MDNNLQEDGDRIESEISITESQDDPSGEDVNDEEDEVEELRNSLKQIVQDESVKPKLQCVMMDPSFSMVTVQSEDSGIVWETASSRCSTPWASEASSTSEAYSLEGSGTQGKIVIIMDEDKIIRKRKKKSGRGKLGERLKRPSSRNFPGGNERPLMTEVSVPNVRPANTDENGESKMDKEQELFSLVSEGYEILNIVVPSRLPTVDEEDSTELADNLSYLEENPRIKSTPKYEQTQEETQAMESSANIIQIEDNGQVIIQVETVNVEPSVPASTEDTADKKKDGATDMDYFEKFTLLDEHIPGESVDAEEKLEMSETEANKTSQNYEKAGDGLSDDTFVFVTDVEIASEHLDEVFYGSGRDDEHDVNRQFENEEEDSVDEREPSKCPVKESGSALFGSEETILTPIFLPSGPPKIIDPILLEEPPAMSFHYTDLYEDAVGVRKKEEEFSDVESVVSEKSFQRRLSDSDDASGYLEKFILKDETPVTEDVPVADDPPEGGRLIWSQSVFELTGCLTRVEEEDDIKEEKEKGESTESFRRSPSPREVCESVNKMSEDKTEDSEMAIQQEEVDMTGRKSPEVCDVEKPVEDKEKEIESTQPSDRLAEKEIEFQPEEISEKKASVKETVTDTTEGLEVAISPETICEEIAPSKEENLIKSDEAAVDQETEIMDQEIAPEIIVVTSEETCEQIASGRESVEDTNKESGIAHCLESAVPDTDEINRTKGEAIDQEIAIMQQEIVPDLTVVKPEETCEEAVTDEEIAKEKVEESVNIERSESVHEEIVTDSETIQIEAVTDEEIAKEKVEESVNIERSESVHEEIVTDSETIQIEAVTDEEIAKEKEEESIDFERSQSVHEEIVTDSENIQIKTVTDEEIAKEKEEESVDVKKSESVREETVTDSENIQIEAVTDEEIAKEKVEESVDVERSESVHEEIVTGSENIQIEAVTDKEIVKEKVEESVDVERSESVHKEIVTDSENIQIEAVTDKEIAKEKVEESVDVERSESVHKEIVTDSENIQMRAEQEHVDQEAEATDVVVEPDEKIKTESEEPECLSHEITSVSDISRGDTTAADVESKDEVNLKNEPPEDICVVTTEEEVKEKHPVSAIEAREDLVEQDVSMSETEQTSKVEPQFPHRTSEDGNTYLIKEEEEAILPEDNGLLFLDDGRNSTEAVGEAQKAQIHRGTDRELLNIHEWHRDNQLKPDSGLAEKRERMLLRLSPLVMAEAVEEEEGEEEEGLRPPLRSFSPQEDLSAFGHEAMLSAPEPFQFLHHDEEVAAELDYDIITQQEASELPKLETEVVKETESPELPDEALDSMQEVDRDQGLEADYEIIESLDGIPLSEAEMVETDLKRESLNTFCLVCRCPISAEDKLSGEHQDHEVTTVEKAYEEIRNKLSERISVLQERSENVTDLVSELELAYNSVEDHCKTSEQRLDEQNDEIMKMVMDQYNEMSQNMEEEKKAKLEQLYDRIVSFQESIDSAKEALEKSTKEIEETDPLTLETSSKDINTSLTTALDAALSLELTPSAFPLFEDYAKSPSGNGRKELKGIPVPQKPHLQPQEPNSATSTSVTVYWKVNEGDIIDCFQVYCMEEPQGAVSEEYRVTVKESYCTLEDLEADKCYKVWVMAVNYTGCSLPSEKLSFKTAPSVPVIDTEKCTVCWDSAIIRWSPTHPNAVESYTLEYCRQYACEGEGLRSISGIRECEQKVLLLASENYLFYIKAANSFGASEQSEAALISTRGTRFHLLPDSAPPALELSEDRATVYYHEEAFNQRANINECLSIQGELLPPRGYHYWETTVGSSDAYRIGVAYPETARDNPLGEDSTSWCIHCVPTATSCRFELLHDNAQTAIFTVEVPTRIGTLLDFIRGRLSFFNAQNGQLLGSHWHRFASGCQAVLALERPGALELHMVSEVPEFAKH
ncbi:cardiomyopathy-associated protein 5 isoform X2 [Anguilla anguilla]|uniref:cardiomyopathy-associated protein 5 isoform X2 n=1 Tax=Anguilla anguilla TaxID=7936 RepID=UPI0015ACBEEE|nr:cardiomyopathy-associated protein 5 isoform X2 [Anguilla anguilla]